MPTLSGASQDDTAPLPNPETPNATAPGAAPLAALEIMQLKAQHAQELTALREERDRALTEKAALQKECAGHLEQLAMERRVSAEFSKRLSLSQKECRELQATLAQAKETPPPAAGSAPPEQAAWEARAADRFEEDIATYRRRIQALLQECETLRQEQTRLTARIAELSGP